MSEIDGPAANWREVVVVVAEQPNWLLVPRGRLVGRRGRFCCPLHFPTPELNYKRLDPARRPLKAATATSVVVPLATPVPFFR